MESEALERALPLYTFRLQRHFNSLRREPSTTPVEASDPESVSTINRSLSVKCSLKSIEEIFLNTLTEIRFGFFVYLGQQRVRRMRDERCGNDC